MTKPPAAIRRAKAGDLEELLRLVEAYYKFDSIAFDERGTAAALRRLLRDESLGRAWVIDAGHALAGYAILTFNYDLEFGGVEGILTDMFVAARYWLKRFGAKMDGRDSRFLRSGRNQHDGTSGNAQQLARASILQGTGLQRIGSDSAES